ncbi:MAG: hypothetical protein R3B82_20340 [Sandaracinaceae bacterium]
MSAAIFDRAVHDRLEPTPADAVLADLEAHATPAGRLGLRARARAALSKRASGAPRQDALPLHALDEPEVRSALRRAADLSGSPCSPSTAPSQARCSCAHEELARAVRRRGDHARAAVARAWSTWLDPDVASMPADLDGVARPRGLGLRPRRGDHDAEGPGGARGRDLESAMEHVRRVVHGAERGIPECEVLASVALARVRRFQNRPHLALRVPDRRASAHAAPAWHPWIEWEAVAAGLLTVHRASGPRAGGLAEMLRCVARGEGDAAHAQADALLGRRDRRARCGVTSGARWPS